MDDQGKAHKQAEIKSITDGNYNALMTEWMTLTFIDDVHTVFCL